MRLVGLMYRENRDDGSMIVMDEIEEKEILDRLELSKHAKLAIAGCLVVFTIISIGIYLGLFTITKQVVTHQAINSIKNISELNVDSVSKSIKNKRTLLETFSINCAKRKITDVNEILEDMDSIVETNDLYSIGVMTEDLTAYLTNGAVLDVSDWPLFREAWKKEFFVSGSYMPAAGGDYAVNMFSYPVIFDGKLQYLIVSADYSMNLTESMNLSSMDGKGYNYILDAEGDVVVYPRFYDNANYNGLMKYLNETSDVIPDETKDCYFKYNGEIYYAHFERMEIDDWYLMTCAREKDVFREANIIITCLSVGMGIFWLMIIVWGVLSFTFSKRSKQSLRKAVYYDEFLKIGNGQLMQEVFRKLTKKERAKMALAIFDIDRFKEFNYIYGEESGDQLLRYIVKIFKEELPDEYLFRYMSDNFGAIVHCASKEEFAEKFNRLLRRAAHDIEERIVPPFDVSVGVRNMANDEPFQKLFSDAMIARGTIKGIQVQQYAFYDANIRNQRTDYMEMESDFSRALKEKEFHVYYQPKINMKTGKIIGAEALVRWVKKDGTIISPGKFIPCFEASRQIILLDEEMLEQVCAQMKEMIAEGLEVKIVSVNLSRVHLRHNGILQKVERIIRDAGIDPGKLSFEITESALYEDSIPLKDIVDYLHRLGCKVDMDDYGVGVSGPNALAANQFDIIKLDKSFIDGIGDTRMESVIRSTIQLSKELGMEILAEGVEEKHQADSLVEWGCVMAQGFYYSRPVPEAEYRKMLEEQQKTSSTSFSS